MRRIGIVVSVAALLIFTTGSAAAAPSAGCSATTSGWHEGTVDSVATEIWDSIVDKTPFPGGIPDLAAALGGLDKNDDGDLCLKRIWGEDLNPRSHWYPVIANYVRDNTAAATDG
jgi:hypothetical protein